MKLLSLHEAIDRFVPDGSSIAMGTALEALIPFAAGHELIRRGRRDLELIGPISDMLFDQLIGAGCVRRITAAWVGNVSAGLGHNYRRAVEHARPPRRPAGQDQERHLGPENRLELEEQRNEPAEPRRGVAEQRLKSEARRLELEERRRDLDEQRLESEAHRLELEEPRRELDEQRLELAEQPLELEEHSNFSLGLGLLAAAMAVPYLPTRTLLGSDLVQRNPRVHPAEPGLLHVDAIEPDVAILHVQRADVEGHAHCWGNLGVSKEAGLAARRVILVAEEIVQPEVILSDPNRILLPPHRVSAVVHAPGGAHPSPVQGYYGRDHAAFSEYHAASRDREGFVSWLQEWVLGVADRDAYLAKLGPRFSALRPAQQRLAASVDYA